MKVSEYFYLQEFVSSDHYRERGEKSLEDLDGRMILTANWVRNLVGDTMYINTWMFGGDRKYSGLRQRGDEYYRPRSQHTYGRAFDAVFKSHVDIDEVRAKIEELWPTVGHGWFITMERDVPWLHVDVRTRMTDRVVSYFDKNS